jgi:ubiquitin-conjugating enzyme E2 variant
MVDQSFAGYVFSAWIAADLLTGVVHWWEDRYGNPAWPIVGRLVVEPNIRHHADQREFLAGGYWHRNWTTIVPAASLACLALAIGQFWWALVAAFATQANEIHGWAHQRCSRPIRGLQLLGVLSSQEGHANHQRAPFATDFCVMTDWLNPILSAVNFWRGLEAAVGILGIRPRQERALA